MDQLRSNNEGAIKASTNTAEQIPLAKRSFTVEFWVGLFTLCGVGAIAFLAIGLGKVSIFNSNRYDIYAEFDNISGLQSGASVEIAGVPVGNVANIALHDPSALVTLRLDNNVKIRDDDIAAIRTKGIIGDRYVKISRGASDTYIPPGGKLPASQTESVVDIEDLIGKIVHSLSGDKSDSETKETSSQK